MGTNYYYTPNPCPTCGHGDTVHIGKSSAGWTFSFHGTDKIRQYADWVAIFNAGGVIMDEYDQVVTVDEFCQMVAEKSSEFHNHAKTYLTIDCWRDSEGNSFCDSEFS